MNTSNRMRVLLAAIALFALVFAAGFALGAARELLLRPWLGADWSRIVEMPVMIAITWAAAGVIVRRFGPLPGEWLNVGLLALALLLCAEFLTGLIVLKVGLFAFLASLATPVGLLGVLAQASLIVFPALKARRMGY